jgi:multisubunit Na+/H+ antiporter MnhC subunit
MGIENSGSIHYALVAALSLTGFFGLFVYDHLLKKILAWTLFQLGTFLLLVILGSHPSGGDMPLNPLPHALAWGVLAVTLAVTLVLFGLSYALYKRYGTSNAGEIAKRVKE